MPSWRIRHSLLLVFTRILLNIMPQIALCTACIIIYFSPNMLEIMPYECVVFNFMLVNQL